MKTKQFATLFLALVMAFTLATSAMAGSISIPTSNNVHTFNIGSFEIDLNADMYVGTINVGWNGNGNNRVNVTWTGNEGNVTVTPYTVANNKQETGTLRVEIEQTADVQNVVFTLTRNNGQKLNAAVTVPRVLTNDEKAVSLVCIDRTMESIHILSKDIGIRLRGMPGEEKAVDWLISEFDKLGLQTEKHEFAATSAAQNVGYITIHNREQFFGLGTFDNGKGGPFMPWHDIWENGAATNGTITGPDAKITGEVVFAGIGTQAEFDAIDVEGKIVLLRTTANATLANRAAQAGAIGLMGFTTTLGGRGNHSQASDPSVTAGSAGSTIPVLGLARAHGEWLMAMADSAPVTIDINTQRINTPFSWNAIGVKPAKNDPDNAPIFMITGHIDSVKGSPGANDNASGVAVTLEAARALSQLDTDNVEIRFIGFGHEEGGLLGATRYVQRMGAAERARVKGVFNMDMTGSKDEERATYWCMMTVDGRPNLVTDTFIATSERLGYGGILELGQFSSSDHVPFHNAGMPAAMGIWFGRPAGYTGQINPQNYTVEAAYHTPLDTIEDNVSVERMKMCIEVVTAAVYHMALNYVESLIAPMFIPVTALEDPYMYILTGAYADELAAAAAAAEEEAAQ